MKRTYLHGTSWDVAQHILKRGIQSISSTQRMWTGSCPELVYLWDTSHEDCMGFSSAADSGLTACIFSQVKKIVVFEVEMSDKYVSEDVSSENMSGCGAVQCNGVPKRFITKYHVSEDVSAFMAEAISQFLNNNFAKGWKISDTVKRYVKHIQPAYMLNEILEEIDWEVHNLKPAKKVAYEYSM